MVDNILMDYNKKSVVTAAGTVEYRQALRLLQVYNTRFRVKDLCNSTVKFTEYDLVPGYIFMTKETHFQRIQHCILANKNPNIARLFK